MTLEPVIPALEAEENVKLKNFAKRFWWTLPLTVIVTFWPYLGISLHCSSEGPRHGLNSAPLTLIRGDLRGIATTRLISVATVRSMKQNLTLALIDNALGIPIASGVLYSVTGWLLSPLIAARWPSIAKRAFLIHIKE